MRETDDVLARESGRLPYPASPLRLAARRAGEYAIVHKVYPPGEAIPVVSIRSAFLTGQNPLSVRFETPYRVHRLVRGPKVKDASILMTDHPQELYQMQGLIQRAFGRVLIGGLGLGIVARWAAKKKDVDAVDVVEVSPEVISLCGRGLGPKVRVHEADLFAWLRDPALKGWGWSYAYFDVWYPTSETTWLERVAPLRRIVRQRFGRVALDCWAEAEMLGQLARALAGDAAMGLEPGACWHDAHKAFRAATLHLWPILPDPRGGTEEERDRTMMERAVARETILASPKFRAAFDCFVAEIGSEAWEQGFGKRWPLVVPTQDDE